MPTISWRCTASSECERARSEEPRIENDPPVCDLRAQRVRFVYRISWRNSGLDAPGEITPKPSVKSEGSVQMADSGQHWLDRNRPPRVQITYDVETGGAIEKKEIPFVVGVMSDLSAKSEVARPKLKERKFVEIDRDSFGTVLEKVKPRVSFTVKNELQPGGKDLLIAFDIKSMDDFRPEQIVKNVPVLNKLFEARTKLNDLLAKLEGNDELNAKLLDLAKSNDALSAIQAAAAPGAPAAAVAPAAADGHSPSTPPAPTTP